MAIHKPALYFEWFSLGSMLLGFEFFAFSELDSERKKFKPAGWCLRLGFLLFKVELYVHYKDNNAPK